MRRLTENKIVLVTRETRLSELVAKYNTVQQARFYVEHLGLDFTDYLREDETYRLALTEATATLETLGLVQRVERRFLANFVFGESDTVVVLGQDGLVANTVKYLAGQPVIGVNPDTARWEGKLLPFQVADLRTIVPEVFAGQRSARAVTMAKAELNTGQKLYAVNDLFIGPKSHTSIRYSIQHEQRVEVQSSSGVIVSTGVGSTGWLRSILAGAQAITNTFTNGTHTDSPQGSFPWDANYLWFNVREPFPTKGTGVSIVSGRVTSQRPLSITSLMPENGVIFSDGLENDFLPFGSGVRAQIGIAEKTGTLVV